MLTNLIFCQAHHPIDCNKKKKRSFHTTNSTNKDTKSPRSSSCMSLYENKISWNSENMQMRSEKQQSKTLNQLVLCFIIPFQSMRHSTAGKWCVCVLALAQMHYLFRHVSESLQCSDMHIIKVCSATVQLNIILFPLPFQTAALQEIIPNKILYIFPTSSILSTCPSHRS